MRRFVVSIALAALLLAGCASVPRLMPSRTVPSRPTLPGASPTSTPGPSLRAESPAAGTLAATGADVAASARALGESSGSWDDWNIYTAALRPQMKPALETLKGMTQYHLNADLAPDLSKLTGQAQIRYTNREKVSLDTIYLHLFPNLWDDHMTVSNARVAGQPISVTLPSGDDIVGLPLPSALKPGESMDLSLEFTTPIPAGKGAGNYGELAHQDGVLALAHFYPTVVVYDDGWHLETPSSQGDVIYHDASLYDVSFTAPSGLNVVATGVTLDKKDHGDGKSTWRLAGGPMRDLNIVASAQYQSVSKQVGDVTVNSHFLPQDSMGGRQALDWAARALQTYESAFGPYAYRELDVVETSTGAGGVEYPGMAVIASRLYSDANSRPFFEAATAHEVAHQWWYNVVGNDQVNYPWMDEALAQYATYLYYRDAYGDAGAQGFEDSWKGRWERVNNAEKPIGLPVSEYKDKEYGAIVYGRGPLFFLALRDQIGEEKMTEFLRRYYTDYTWRIASPTEFENLAETVSGEDLSPLFKKWVYP